MGTVGLSFGSPTSGTGFDVSSTVAAIVANLQNVETPWKNQLTSLESEDTVISSLGTLFSNLSNDMNSLTDAQGILAEKEGSSSDTSVLELTSASSSAAAGTYSVVVNSLATTANGYLDPITNSSDTLTGSITINGTSVDVPDSSTGDDTLSGLVSAINDADLGVTASVSTDANGSRLSLISNTTGASGSLSVTSAVTDAKTSTALNYNSNLATGANASLTVNGVSYSEASNTVSNLIPGVTFDLLGTSSSGSEVQVVIANDNSDVESTVNQFVTDYNSLISAINTQEGNTSSGTPEPLFGSPTLSLLQEQLLNGLNTQNPNGYMSSVSADAGVTLSGSMTIAIGSGTAKTVEIGAAPSAADGGPAANTIYTGSGSDYNTLAGLAAAINASSTPLSYADTGYTSSTDYDTGTVGEVSNTGDSLSGSLSIAVGSGTANTLTMADVDSSEEGTTLSDLVNYINSNSSTLGVTATTVTNADGSSSLSLQSTTAGTDGALTVTSGLVDGIQASAAISTSDGESTLSLTSETSGSSGTLAVTSAIQASTPTALSFTDSGYSSTTADKGTLASAASSTDTLAGSITVQVGSGTAQTIDMSAVESAESGDTLGDLQQYIYDNSSTLGFTASIVNNSDGSQSLTLTSNTVGSAGALTVTSNLYDTKNTTSSTLDYTNSSDIGSLTSLGISINNDGSLTFDSNSLDSVLNADYSGVVGFFQNANSWGQTFANTLTNAGTSSPTGILSLASSSNSSIESTLNAEISKEQSYISAQQKSLTTELNSANEIMQELPSQLNGINELYSAITGYNENSSG